MAVYAISDLHLALSVNKPMDVFGYRWNNYMERLKINWLKTVSSDDYVIIPGDISWATYLQEAKEDFTFINELPGKKIISKGNHDYWWTTIAKLEKFVTSMEFNTISFMHNNSYNLGQDIVCGTRGWICPGNDDFGKEDEKIYKREVQRLELSLKTIPDYFSGNIIVAMHYPPFNSKKESTEFVEIMKKYKVTKCIYGHLHGDATRAAFQGMYDNICFQLISADFIDFNPVKINE